VPVAVPADESSDGLEVVAPPGVSPGIVVAPAVPPEAPVAALAESPADVTLVTPPVELPDEPPVLVTAVAPPVAAVDAAAAAVGGGERLPDVGKGPPPDWSLCALFVAGLRAADLAAALFSAAAKSLPSVFWAEKSADAAPPACAALFVGWAALMRGALEITGITFIEVERASDVPSGTPRPTIV
jgi:hypothetical protein